MQSILCFLAFFLVSPAVAIDPPQPFTAPVVLLYQERLALARIETEQARVKLKYRERRVKRLEEAFQSGAIPEATMEENWKERDLEKLMVLALEAKTKQAEALFEIAKQRIMNGQEMPFCKE